MSAEEKPGNGRKPRRRYTPEEKIRLLDEADKACESIGTVARRHGISPSVMFGWRRLRETGAMTAVKADEELVPVSEMRTARTRIRELQRLLGKKTEEVEILKEGLEIARAKKWISRSPSPLREGEKG